MGREIRRVPENWQHPKRIKQIIDHGVYKIDEGYRSMYQGEFSEAVADFHEEMNKWMEGYNNWNNGFYSDWEKGMVTKEEAMKKFAGYIIEERKKHKFSQDYCEEELQRYEKGICSWTDVSHLPTYPNPEYYMPFGEWYQLFQTVSEGTPLSPPFATKEELIEWLSNNKDFWGNKWSREGAESMVKEEYAPSMIFDGSKIYKPEDMYLMKK